MSTVKILGLTGGIGSGKSTAALMLGEHMPGLNLDDVSRQVMAPGNEGFARVAAHFGEGIVSANGDISRSDLAKRVFSDRACLDELEAILHPLIWEVFRQWKDSLQCSWAYVEAPMLFESDGVSYVDKVLQISCPVDERRKRVEARGAPGLDFFDAIVDRQWSDHRRESLADFVIHNIAGLVDFQMNMNDVLLRMDIRV